MKRLLSRRLPILRLRAFKRGVVDGNTRWLTVWGLLVGARVLKRLANPKPDVECFELRPGQTLLITEIKRSDEVEAGS
ncbi:MAG: hypothetical protein ABIV94_12140 [Acidimicrobiales bacterium]